jgi:hypothetical protein
VTAPSRTLAVPRLRRLVPITVILAAGCGADPSGPVSAPAATSPVSAPAATAIPGVTDPARSEGTPLTPAQANALARGLHRNGEVGGATVEVTIPFGTSTIVVAGDVDWKRHVGAATVTTRFADGVRLPRTEQVFWSRTTVVLPMDGLGPAMAERGRPGVRWLARPLDGSTAALDRVLTFLDALASDRPENPLLLRQRPEVAYLGREDVDGQAADRYRSSASAQFWLAVGPGPQQGRILAVRAVFAGLDLPALIRLRNHGPRTLQFPPEAEVVAAAEIPDVVARLAAGSPAAAGSTAAGSPAAGSPTG